MLVALNAFVVIVFEDVDVTMARATIEVATLDAAPKCLKQPSLQRCSG